MNPEEYYERFADTTDNKKHKGLKKSTPDMDFDSYSSRLSDLSEYFSEFLKKPDPVKQIEQKRFQIIKESMQMKSVSKVQFILQMELLQIKVQLLFCKWNFIFAIRPSFIRKRKKTKR